MAFADADNGSHTKNVQSWSTIIFTIGLETGRDGISSRIIIRIVKITASDTHFWCKNRQGCCWRIYGTINIASKTKSASTITNKRDTIPLLSYLLSKILTNICVIKIMLPTEIIENKLRKHFCRKNIFIRWDLRMQKDDNTKLLAKILTLGMPSSPSNRSGNTGK